ncbi:hypothetical protein [Desulfobacter sp.]|uniref:hypothetical protein n=1 Tax=Desulfobacter sp. TaxID=2294 RepID=UPI003D11FBB4
MADPSVNPKNVLIKNENTDLPPELPKPPEKVFALQVNAWGTLQDFIANALQLPILQSDFEERYGTFEDEALVEKGIELLKGLKDAADAFGNVVTESQDIMKYIGTDTPPESLFAHGVWLASKIESTAMTVSNYAASAIPALEKETDPQKRAEDIKELLTYPGAGMYSYAIDLNGKCNDYNGLLSTYVENTFKPASDAFHTYFTTQENTILTDAQNIVDSELSRINELTLKVASLKSKLYGWSIGGSVGCVVASGLPPLFIFGSAILLGFEIEECIRIQKEIDKDNDEIKKLKADELKKAALVTDLTTLINSSQNVDDAAKAFLQAVVEMAEGFGLCATDMKTISDLVEPKKVADLPPFLQNTGLETAEKDWKEIQLAANNFINSGQYKYETAS